MIAYTLYTYVYVMYVFSRDSIKCSKYTHKSVPCDKNFLEANFDRLSKEKIKLKAA
jgi:hypothetical protein